MKILYLKTHYYFGLKAGGSIGHISGVINSLEKRVNLSVVSNENIIGINIRPTIVKPITLSFLPEFLLEILYSFKVILCCRQYRVDAIYQRYSASSFCGAYLSKKYRVKLLIEFNGSDIWLAKNWNKKTSRFGDILNHMYYAMKLPILGMIERYILHNACCIIAVSSALKENLIDSGIKSSKIVVIPNGVDENKYNPQIKCDDVKQKYNLENKIVIGFIGTFGQWHGAENIALAFGKLLKKSPEYKNKAKLFMIGDGVRMPIVKKHILEFGLQENVVLTGLIPQEQGAKFLSACDILINATVPNPDGSEFFGSPTKLFEYMAMGKAIICSNMAQMSEILEHGKTAYMVEPGNIDELATAMKELVDDGELRQRLGDSARDEVIQKYTWDKHVDKILRALNRQ